MLSPLDLDDDVLLAETAPITSKDTLTRALEAIRAPPTDAPAPVPPPRTQAPTAAPKAGSSGFLSRLNVFKSKTATAVTAPPAPASAVTPAAAPALEPVPTEPAPVLPASRSSKTPGRIWSSIVQSASAVKKKVDAAVAIRAERALQHSSRLIVLRDRVFALEPGTLIRALFH